MSDTDFESEILEEFLSQCKPLLTFAWFKFKINYIFFYI